MKKRVAFEGCWTALATPMSADGGVDARALRALVKRQIRGGISGLVACGSTGEAATLSPAEYRQVVRIVLDEAAARVPVAAGIGTASTWKTQETAREAESWSVDALLVLSPYYNKPTQEGLYQHFKAVAGSTRLPIIVYNIPGRTAVNILPQTLSRLAKSRPNVAAVKEASGNVDQVSEIVSLLGPSFPVLSGDDSLTLPMMAVGARGVVSVLSNVAPRQTAELCRSFLQGDIRRAQRLHIRLLPLIKALFVETNPIPVKAALEMLGISSGAVRLPLTPLSPNHRALLRSALKKAGLL